MAYGAYVDLGKYETLQIDDKWAEVMSILYRPVTKQIGESYQIKAYDAVLDGEPFLDVPMHVHFGALSFFFSFANGLSERYPEVFGDSAGGGDTSPHQINFSRKWKAYSSIHQLANGDITKYEEILREPLEKCLLFLAYQSDVNFLQTLLHREAMAKNK
jgi:hypothetical protein